LVGEIAFQDRKFFLLRRNRKSLGVLNMEEYGSEKFRQATGAARLPWQCACPH
jgi:hypothetical protein